MAAPEPFVMIFFFTDLHHREAVSPDVARLSLSSDTSLSPSPPVSATAAPGNRKLQGFRARRLRLNPADSEHLPVSGKARCSPQIGTAAGNMERALQQVQQVQQVTRTRSPQVAHIHHPPPTSAPAEGHMDPWYGSVYMYQSMNLYSINMKYWSSVPAV